jgi:hypothetical protein
MIQLRGQCLDRRIGEREVLVSEIHAWQRQRNESGARIRGEERGVPRAPERFRTMPQLCELKGCPLPRG